MAWTEFADQFEGGEWKMEKRKIYIEAEKGLAAEIFKKRFGFCPLEKGAYCLASDKSLAQLTAYDRGCEYLITDRRGGGRYLEKPRGETPYYSVEDYLKREDVLPIFIDDISPKEMPDAAMLPVFAEMAIDEALKKAKAENLRLEIDEALLNRDEALFASLSAELRELEGNGH